YQTQVLESPSTVGLKPHQKPYTVNGQRYEPLPSHQGFVQQGLASWYGRKFHGRKTSNGEIYNMYAMTAAHKTLPLGTSVRVHNLANGRQTVVRVNDRGPFVQGRIIDLSYAAADKLGVVGPGTAPVKIEALGFQAQDAAGRTVYRSTPSDQVESYAVQVASFSSDANAQRLAAELRSRYGSASVCRNLINGSNYFRVWVGKYPSLDAAESAKLTIEGHGFNNCFVVAKD
ncbi:MAG: septal ring lytic transglycosylase RlpA family lipoprotein, partial [Desulfuromonas sp.]